MAALHVNQWDDGLGATRAFVEAGPRVDEGGLADSAILLDRARRD